MYFHLILGHHQPCLPALLSPNGVVITASPYERELQSVMLESKKGQKKESKGQKRASVKNTKKSSSSKILFLTKINKQTQNPKSSSSTQSASSDETEIPAVSTENEDTADEEFIFCNNHSRRILVENSECDVLVVIVGPMNYALVLKETFRRS